MLAGKFGTFLGVDENTRKKNSMDVARILLRTNWYDVFNIVVHANINGDMFHIKVLEEWCGPMHWEGLTHANKSNQSEKGSDSDSEDDNGDGPPLFVAEEEEEGFSGDEEGEDEGERDQALMLVTLIEGRNEVTNEPDNHDDGGNENTKEIVNLDEGVNVSIEEKNNNDNEGVHGEVAVENVDEVGESQSANNMMAWEGEKIKENNGLMENEIKAHDVEEKKAAHEVAAVKVQEPQNVENTSQDNNKMEVEDCGSGIGGDASGLLIQCGGSGPINVLGQNDDLGRDKGGLPTNSNDGPISKPMDQVVMVRSNENPGPRK